MAALKSAKVYGCALPVLLAGLVLSVAVASPASAGDANRGKTKAAVCAVCHGLDGVSANPEAPNLSGQIETYLVTSLQAYRNGQRKNPMMSVVAKPLTDAEIADLAAWYSSIPVTISGPQ